MVKILLFVFSYSSSPSYILSLPFFSHSPPLTPPSSPTFSLPNFPPFSFLNFSSSHIFTYSLIPLFLTHRRLFPINHFLRLNLLSLLLLALLLSLSGLTKFSSSSLPPPPSFSMPDSHKCALWDEPFVSTGNSEVDWQLHKYRS